MDLLHQVEQVYFLVMVHLLLERTTKGEDPDCPRDRCNDGRCPRNYYEHCPEYRCESLGLRRCSGSLLCVPSTRSCPGEQCALSELLCLDGTCVGVYEECRDGSEGCSNSFKRCANGECQLKIARCPEDPCPHNFPFKCDKECKPMSVICDNYRDCEQGEDEFACNEATSELWYLLLLLLIPAFCCCYYSYKGCTQKEKPRYATDIDIAITNINNINTNMSNFTMTSQTTGPSQSQRNRPNPSSQLHSSYDHSQVSLQDGASLNPIDLQIQNHNPQGQYPFPMNQDVSSDLLSDESDDDNQATVPLPAPPPSYQEVVLNPNVYPVPVFSTYV